MDPINYNIDVKSPFEQAVGGYQVGAALSDISAKRQDAERARQLQMQMQADLGTLAQNPNPTAREYATVMTRYPQIAEHLKKGFDILQPEQQQQRLSSATQIYAAVNANQPEVAIGKLREEATALRNAGKDKEAKAADDWAKVIELNPAAAKASMGLMLSSVMGADKFSAAFPAIGKEGRDVALGPSQLQESQGKARQATAEATIKELEAGDKPEAIRLRNDNTRATVSKIYSDIGNAADRLTLDRDKLRADVEMFLYGLEDKKGTLPEDARKLVNESAIASVTAKQHGQRLLNLATDFEKMNPLDGFAAKGAENWKQAFGSQDEVTNLRREYTRLRSTDILKLLPPGPASDRDIMLAQKGFLDDTADPKTLASFLRGMAKLSQFDSVLNAAKTEWVNSNASLGSAKRDLVVDGVRVPVGTTFGDFSDQFLKRKADQLGAEQSLGQARQLGRGYLRYGQEQQPQPSAGATGAF